MKMLEAEAALCAIGIASHGRAYAAYLHGFLLRAGTPRSTPIIAVDCSRSFFPINNANRPELMAAEAKCISFT